MRDHIFRNRGLPRTKPYVLHDDFSNSYVDVRDKQQQAFAFFKRRSSMTIGTLSEPWISVTRFALLNKNSKAGYTWGLKAD